MSNFCCEFRNDEVVFLKCTECVGARIKFSVTMPYILVDTYRRFRETCCLYCKGSLSFSLNSLRRENVKRHANWNLTLFITGLLACSFNRQLGTQRCVYLPCLLCSFVKNVKTTHKKRHIWQLYVCQGLLVVDCQLISFTFSGIFLLSCLRRLLVNACSCVAYSIVYCNTVYRAFWVP